ncbi:glycosyl hydrolases family 18-domain-containing protein [Stachybotrys elegans]|uniref:chitinase n=1 Tax=Stachybotrys elegans TaxID=80388 RepID=A0A8K0WST3_9HYPO|nr:glycosyl hydrolases family 18-domain-containing protein [Stachybotrys elegans]
MSNRSDKAQWGPRQRRLKPLALTARCINGFTLTAFKAPHLEARQQDDGLVCPPIPDKLVTGADLIAKLRFNDRDTCEAGPRLEARSDAVSTMAADPNDPYSCSEVKPCSNGACCSKTGVCNYGPEACGTNGQSPNDKCWSNCDAHAECGRFAKEPGKKCPLNVCCSQHGFCGMTSEFCSKDQNCQSNCEQPGSGASGGNVQKRVIGYYEAWNWKKKCIGMSMEDIPVNSLTHIYYSFAYIRPKTYEIVPMEDDTDGKLTTETFSEFTALKRKNPSLMAVVALGGWTFNDNGTIWQPVFSDLSSTKEKRATFIKQLIKFMNRYGFDGVDFDWEYPGAPDRGGKPDDGVNLTKLFKELRIELDKTYGRRKEISFTAPTSYWYMRHFDITASAKAVDYVNVMSYDLHGVWDANNPIGSQVLAHTNLTEIDLALDLFWRNKVEPSKINLGIGFYGRSFQLADPSCHTPGCLFLGGAKPGPCTKNSGTLSYFEIMDIIRKYDLSPYWDEKDAVKYITWAGDQWVSYDDQDTIQQKIEFANNLGLGGLLIWAIDLDDRELDALAAVLHPGGFGAHKDRSTMNPWTELGDGHCTVSECGSVGCELGWVEVDRAKCNDREWKSSVCCPFSSAPDPDKCTWRGTGVLCNGQCHDGEVALASSTLAGGGFGCTDGRKFLCCEAEAQKPDCRWTDCGGKCDSDENELTWKSGECKSGKQKKFCCDKSQEWKNCGWRGKPGSCFDNHCETGWQVALTRSHGGEDEDCGWASRRKRTFCCDPPDGDSPFLPVPLDYLFPDAPPEEEADPEWSLKVDGTWGGARPGPFAETPEASAFGFVVMTGPDDKITTLRRRDGSHWELFDCHDAVTEGEQTVRMVCGNNGDDSNCGKIHLGHGAPGTIVSMPDGCGPGRYAVVKEMTPSKNQSLPHHLSRRGVPESETVYDLTFDYDFRRVPRDSEKVQLRIDYSNENTYWKTIVDKAADHKRKLKKRGTPERTLEDVGGSHKRWLEEEWRDDEYGGAISKDELHKRWFGETIIDWLKAQLYGVTNPLDHAHKYEEDFTLSIIDQKLTCPNMDAKLEVFAEMKVEMDINYGLTLIATLGGEYGIDISGSYLYYRTAGDVEANFVVDAAVTAHIDTGDVLMFSADTFGASFTVPGLVTIGPNFKLFGRMEGRATLGVNFESKVKLAEWNVYQTYPVANQDWEPDSFNTPRKSGKQVLDPEFEYGVTVDGHLTAHVKPTVTFGIDWNKKTTSLEPCAVNLVADGYVTFHAEASAGSDGNRLCYGIDAGAGLYATIEAPDMLNWALPESPFMILPTRDVTLFPKWNDDGCHTPRSSRIRRETEYGPLIPRIEGLMCPGAVDLDGIPSCNLCGDDDSLDKRDGEVCMLDPYPSSEEPCPSDSNLDVRRRSLEERKESYKTNPRWEYGGDKYELKLPSYKGCSDAVSESRIQRWYGYPEVEANGCQVELQKLSVNQIDKGSFVKCVPSRFIAEHVYEAQLLLRFINWLWKTPLPAGYTNPTRDWISEVVIGCPRLNGQPNRIFQHSSWGSDDDTWDRLASGLGSSQNPGRLVLADGWMNKRKEVLFAGHTPSANNVLAGVFYYMSHPDIWPKFTATSQHMENVWKQFDDEYDWGGPDSAGEPGLPTRTTGQPRAGLRDLYCYWIESELRNIEARADTWVDTATRNYRKDFGGRPIGDRWLANVLNPSGYISATKLKFPKARTSHKNPNPGSPDIWLASNYQGLWAHGAAGPF